MEDLQSTAERGDDKPGGPLRLRHFLVPLDGSPLADAVLARTSALAEVFSAQITLLRVLESPPVSVAGTHVNPVDWELVRAEAQGRLAALRAELEEKNVKTRTQLVEGRAAEQILLYAQQHDIDLIALSTHGEGGLSAWSLSSTIQKVIARANQSLFIVPTYRDADGAAAAPPFAKILLPLDCSPRAECTLRLATDIARAHDGALILAHVVTEPELSSHMPPSPDDLELVEKLTRRNRESAEGYLRELQERLGADGVRSQIRILVSPRRGRSLRALAQDEDVDLIVFSAHGRTGDPAERYGGIAARLLQECSRPVLIVQDLAHEVRARSTAEEIARGHPGH